jgi:adenylyltransferase/sulfurtransferase
MDSDAGPDGGADDVPHVDVEALRRRLEAGGPVQILDVRQPHEWEICNLGEHGADLVPLGDLPEALDRVREDRPVVVHCRSGGRSARAVRLLRERGYENAVNLAGGILAWAQEIDPEMTEY